MYYTFTDSSYLLVTSYFSVDKKVKDSISKTLTNSQSSISIKVKDKVERESKEVHIKIN